VSITPARAHRATATRTYALVLALGALLARPASLVAQAADSSALGFLGFHPGARIEAVAARVDSLDGRPLACERSRVDPHVTECRTTLHDPDVGGTVEVWLSAVDSVAGVLTLAGAVTADQLDAWRARLERRYGQADARVQGTQWMMQWVRQRRMVRLTWRSQQGARAASVSLVDGHVLDAWRPATPAPPTPRQPARRTRKAPSPSSST
jgi:hypothetical protein